MKRTVECNDKNEPISACKVDTEKKEFGRAIVMERVRHIYLPQSSISVISKPIIEFRAENLLRIQIFFFFLCGLFFFFLIYTYICCNHFYKQQYSLALRTLVTNIEGFHILYTHQVYTTYKSANLASVSNPSWVCHITSMLPNLLQVWRAHSRPRKRVDLYLQSITPGTPRPTLCTSTWERHPHRYHHYWTVF